MRRKSVTNAARKFIATIKDQSVAIIGGGIGGLTAACAFAQRGAKVKVYEQAKALADVGAGIQITPNGARALKALSIDIDGLDAKAVLPTDGLTGKTIARFDVSRKRPAYTFVHRATLIDALAQAAEASGASITLNAPQTAPLDSADLTVGADGIHSHLRPLINGEDDPLFTGQVAWRALIKRDASQDVRIWMMPGKHVVTYPLPGGLLNIVAVEERFDWAESGWHHPDDPNNLRAAFSNSCNELQSILEQVEATNLWGLFLHPIAKRWHKDNCVILGDAAHPTLPFLAQGANLAIEDAYVLAKCCDSHALPAALRRYTQLRRPRVSRAIAAANGNARNYHLRGPGRSLSFVALQTLGWLAPNAFLNRYNWLYDHDVTT